MKKDPGQSLAIFSKALQLSLLSIPDGLRGTKERHCNSLKLFGCVARATCAILLVYRENNLGHGSPRFQLKKSELRKVSEEQLSGYLEEIYWNELAAAEKALLALEPTSRMLARTQKTRTSEKEK